MNIVFGGSFNPVTKAHKSIIKDLINIYQPDNFIIAPVGDIYNKNNLLKFEDRINMLKISLCNLDVIISDLENQDKNFLGTYELLSKLSKTYEDLYFVMGADNLINIKSWLNIDKLLNNYKFIIIKRNEFNIDTFLENNLNEYKDNFLIYNVNLDMSASLIRSDLFKYKNHLDDDVYEYIIKNNLYKKEE